VPRAQLSPGCKAYSFLRLDVHLQVKAICIASLLDAPNDVLELIQPSFREDVVKVNAYGWQRHRLVNALVPRVDMAGMDRDAHAVSLRHLEIEGILY